MSYALAALAVGMAIFGVVFFVVGGKEAKRLDASLEREVSTREDRAAERETSTSEDPAPTSVTPHRSTWPRELHSWERRLRVLLGDEQVLFRRGLEVALANEPDIEIVGEAASGQEVLTQVELKQPNIVLLDVRLPGMSGLEIVKRIRESHPDIQALILMPDDNETLLIDALRAGALGYLSKADDAMRLAKAVREVAGGDIVIDPALANILMRRLMRQPRYMHNETSTAREIEVLRLLTTGVTTREIAQFLEVNPRSVTEVMRSVIERIASASH